MARKICMTLPYLRAVAVAAAPPLIRRRSMRIAANAKLPE